MIPRTLVDLLTDQIEFANVMVLNKVGAAAPGRLEQARKIIRALDPDAKVIETDDSRIHPVWVFVTSLFDFNRTHEHPLWAKELYGFAHHVPETEEYGVSSFKYRARRPLDPVRIHAVLKGEPKGVIRAQGHFWIATVPIGLPSSVLRGGGRSTVSPLGRWWAGVPRDWPTISERLDAVALLWQEPWGDGRQELVFIGFAMDEAAITRALGAALVSENALLPDDWVGLPDPFPARGTRGAG